MVTYKTVMDIVQYGTDKDCDYFKTYLYDKMVQIVAVGLEHGVEVISLYLIKATDSAPIKMELEEVNNERS